MTISPDNIFPLIVPADYYIKGTWELPHQILPNQSFILTWVTFGAAATMNYLTRDQYVALNNHNTGWQQKAFENLRLSIAENENFFSHFKMDDSGQHILWLCFMNGDGIGSSRILLSAELTRAFPNGYYLAFPDRSCGLVIAKDISERKLEEIKDMIQGIYSNATTAMSQQLHPASDFALPDQLTQPIDKEFSNLLTNEIFKLLPAN